MRLNKLHNAVTVNKVHAMNQYSKQAGVTLIETLVTVVILAIGMLGLATMQSTSVRLSYDSYLRSQAAFLAYDLIDRMRANPEANVYTLSENATLPKVDCFNGDNCTVAQLRSHDLYYWQNQLETLMPDAKAEVTYDNSQDLYSMTIRWDDRVSNDVDEDDTKQFVYHFQIGD